MSDDARTSPDDATLAEEAREATRAHEADRAASEDEARAADKSRDKFADDAQSVAEHEESMTELGARLKGEGEIP
jgi:hypothetical protein